jgi:hypothetical protein
MARISQKRGVPETLDPDRLLDLKVEADHEVDQEDGSRTA